MFLVISVTFYLSCSMLHTQRKYAELFLSMWFRGIRSNLSVFDTDILDYKVILYKKINTYILESNFCSPQKHALALLLLVVGLAATAVKNVLATSDLFEGVRLYVRNLGITWAWSVVMLSYTSCLCSNWWHFSSEKLLFVYC